MLKTVSVIGQANANPEQSGQEIQVQKQDEK